MHNYIHHNAYDLTIITSMSFFDQQLHLAHGHPDELCLSAPGGPTCCLACLFSSLSEPTVLRTQKVYVLRSASLLGALRNLTSLELLMADGHTSRVEQLHLLCVA